MKCAYCTMNIENPKILKNHEKLHKKFGHEKIEIDFVSPELDEERKWTGAERAEVNRLTKKVAEEKKERVIKNNNDQKIVVQVIREEPPKPKWDTINILQTKDGIEYVPCPHCGGALIINVNSEGKTIEHMEVMSDFMDYLFRGPENATDSINS